MNPRHFVVKVEVEGNSQVWFKREKRKEKEKKRKEKEKKRKRFNSKNGMRNLRCSQFPRIFRI